MSFFVENGILSFLLLTVVLGGGAAYLSGRALASGWKSPWVLAVYMLMFTAGIRFLHFALFEGQLTSLTYYVSHGLIILALAMIGYRVTLAQQMTQKYPWLYERSGPFAWREKSPS
jgi:hypothetical protein